MITCRQTVFFVRISMEKKRNLSVADKVNLFIESHKHFLYVISAIMLIADISYCTFIFILYPDSFSVWPIIILIALILFIVYELPWRDSIWYIPILIATGALWYIEVTKLESYCLKDAKCKIEVITDKQTIELRHSTKYRITLNGNNGGLDISRMDYKRVKVGDTIVMRYSIDYPHIKKIHILKPRRNEIELYKKPQHFIGDELQPKPIVEQYSNHVKDSLLQQSHCQVGYVYEKIDDDYYRHFLRVGIADSLTSLYEFVETERLYSKVYKRLSVGNIVTLQVSDTNPQINRVLNWRPNNSDIEMLIKPVDYADYKTRIAFNCKKYDYLNKTHTHYVYVQDKYEDEYVGAYLEIGIDEKNTRAYVFKKYSDIYESTYRVLNVGDAVVAELSESTLQVKRIIDWRLPRNKQ